MLSIKKHASSTPNRKRPSEIIIGGENEPLDMNRIRIQKIYERFFSYKVCLSEIKKVVEDHIRVNEEKSEFENSGSCDVVDQFMMNCEDHALFQFELMSKIVQNEYDFIDLIERSSRKLQKVLDYMRRRKRNHVITPIKSSFDDLVFIRNVFGNVKIVKGGEADNIKQISSYYGLGGNIIEILRQYNVVDFSFYTEFCKIERKRNKIIKKYLASQQESF